MRTLQNADDLDIRVVQLYITMKNDPNLAKFFADREDVKSALLYAGVPASAAEGFDDLGWDIHKDPFLLVAEAMKDLYRRGMLSYFLTQILRTGVRPKFQDEFLQHLHTLGLDWDRTANRICLVGTPPVEWEVANNSKQGADDLIAGPLGRGDDEKATRILSKRIFVVHGKDEKNTGILKEMLIQWGFDPIIMIEKPHMGRTLIEKLIDLGSNVGYVLVLMTPDDVGIERAQLVRMLEGFESVDGHHPARPEELAVSLKGRARQNVIFEYGMFMGHLGRHKVCLLKKGDVDFPTDLLGLGYIQFKEEVSEKECKEQIERELRGAGYELKS